MTDPLRHVFSGEPFRAKSTTWNAFVDAARAHREGNTGFRSREKSPWPQSAMRILVRNLSGTDLPPLRALQLGDVVIAPSANEPEWRDRPAFDASIAAAPQSGRWCVLAEPVANGRFGFAYASGVFPALVDVSSAANDEGWNRCDLKSDESVLAATERGSGRLLWREAGTGLKRAIVSLGDGGVPLKLGCGLKRDEDSGEVAIDPDFFGHGLFYTPADPEADPPTACRLDGNVRSFSLDEDLGGAHGTAETSDGEVLSAPTSFGYAFGEAENGWDDPTLVPAIHVGQGTWIAIGPGHHAVLGCAGEAHDGFEWEGEEKCLASAVDAIPLHGLPSDAVGTVVLPAGNGTTFTAPHTITGCLFPHAAAADETVVAHKIKPLFVPVLSSPLLPPVVEEIHWVALPIRPPGGDPDLGCGLKRDEETGAIGVDPEMFGDGLQFLDCVLSVKAGCGLAIDGEGNVTVDTDDLAGAGLVPGGGCALDVNPGEGITVAGDEVALDIPSLPADSTPQPSDVVATHDGEQHNKVTVEDVRGFLGDHKDTEIAGPEFAQVLKFVDPFWSNAFLHLYELADTLIQNPAAGHHLKHDGTRWINYLPDTHANFHGCCGWVWNANAEDWCWKFGDCDPEEDKPATPPPFTPYDGQLVIICEACGKPTLCVQAIGDPIAEDGEAGAFRICRTGSTEEPLVVHFTLSGTAVEGTDYETLDDDTEATIPIGESCVDVVIIPIDNQQVDDPQNRTVILTLDADAAYSINPECDEATLTIEDDEEPPPPPGETDYVLSGGFDSEAVNVAMLDGFSSSVLTSMGGPSSLGDWRGAGSDGTDTPHAGSKNFSPNEETVYWFAGQFTSTLLASVTDEDVMFFVEASDDGTDTLAGVIHNSTSETMRLYSGKVTSTILDQQSPSEGIAGGISTDGTDTLVSGGDRLLKYAGILSTTKLEDVTIGTGSFTGNHGITWNGGNPVFLDSESDPVSINEQDGWTTTTLASVDVSSIITSDPPLGIEAEDPAVRLST